MRAAADLQSPQRTHRLWHGDIIPPLHVSQKPVHGGAVAPAVGAMKPPPLWAQDGWASPVQ